MRRELHNKYLTASAGITGANLLIADVGAVCTVTNDGNAESTASPAAHSHCNGGAPFIDPSTSWGCPGETSAPG